MSVYFGSSSWGAQKHYEPLNRKAEGAQPPLAPAAPAPLHCSGISINEKADGLAGERYSAMSRIALSASDKLIIRAKQKEAGASQHRAIREVKKMVRRGLRQG